MEESRSANSVAGELLPDNVQYKDCLNVVQTVYRVRHTETSVFASINNKTLWLSNWSAQQALKLVAKQRNMSRGCFEVVPFKLKEVK